MRICGDYKLTVNQTSKLEQYPIPKLEDSLEKLAGGEKYSKLDLSHAYQQMILDEESKRYVTLNTHKGLFTVNRLLFGVASSHRIMEGLLQGIPGIAIYLDDILIIGRDYQEHLHTLSEVFPISNKMEALQKAPAPRNVTELKAYLGLLNYYHRFLPNLSIWLAPLHNLLRKSVKWH